MRRRRHRPAGDRPARARARAAPAAGRAAVHRRRARVRRRRGAARRSTSPRASAPRRRSRRRSRCDGVRLARRRGLGGGDGPPGVGCPAAPPRARPSSASTVRDLAHALQGHGRRGGDAAVSRPALARAAARRRADARDRRWAIEDAGDPVARADGARGRGARARGRRARARRAGSRSSAARATTAATGSSPRGCCARPGARSTCCALWPPQWLSERRARRCSRRLPGRRAASRSTPARLAEARGHRRRAARHRLERRAAGPGRAARSRRSTAPSGRVSPPTCRAASTRRTGEVAGRGRARGRDGDLPPRQAGAVDPPGQGARGRGARGRHRHPARRAGRGRRRADRRRACCATCRGAAPARRSSAPATSCVVGGSRGLTGAPCMSALAAMRAGAGYVTVAAPASLELVVRGAAARGDVVGAARGRRRARRRRRCDAALAAVGRADAVVLGPGLGRAPGAQELARELVAAHRRAAA